MAKQDKKSGIKPQSTTSVKMMIRVEYVGIIAVACLLMGAIIGNLLSNAPGKTGNSTPTQSDSSMAASQMSDEEINRYMSQIGQTSNFEALVSMGNAAMDQKITALAVAAYEKALTINPKDPNVITDLGAVYNDQMGQPQRALELFKRAAKLDAEHVQSRFNMGIAYMHLKDMDSAKKAFEEVVKLFPGTEQANEASHQMELLKNSK